jgi:hypothetical protein
MSLQGMNVKSFGGGAPALELSNISTLGNNVFIGQRCGNKTNVQGGNVFLGTSSGENNTTGKSNVFIGTGSGRNNQLANQNVFIGTGAGANNAIGQKNVYIGTDSGKNTKSGNSNVFLGTNVGENNTSGNKNVFIGTETGQSNANGNDNVFLGVQAGLSNRNGSENVFIGNKAGLSNQGNSNILIGYQAGQSNDQNNNVFIGTGCGSQLTGGTANVYLGVDAGGPGKHVFISPVITDISIQNDDVDDTSYPWFSGIYEYSVQARIQYNIYKNGPIKYLQLNLESGNNMWRIADSRSDLSKAPYNTPSFPISTRANFKLTWVNDDKAIVYMVQRKDPFSITTTQADNIREGDETLAQYSSFSEPLTKGAEGKIYYNGNSGPYSYENFNVVGNRYTDSPTPLDTTNKFPDDAFNGIYFGVGNKGAVPSRTEDGSVSIIDSRRLLNFLSYSGAWNNSLYRYDSFPNDSVVVGYQAGFNTVASDGTIILGHKAAYSNICGKECISIGYEANYTCQVPANNVTVGFKAARSCSNMDKSTIIGDNCALNSTDINDSVCIGYKCGNRAVELYSDVIIGSQAAGNLAGKNRSVIIGDAAGAKITSAYYSVMIGHLSCNDETIVGCKKYNVCVGVGTLQTAGTSNNVVLGYHAGQSANVSNSILIGYKAGSNSHPISDGDNCNNAANGKLIIGNGNSALIEGDLGTTGGESKQVTINGDFSVTGNITGHRRHISSSIPDADTTGFTEGDLWFVKPVNII